MQFRSSILIFLSFFIHSFMMCQEIVEAFEQEECILYDPKEANNYYFSLLPSDISQLILSHYSYDFRKCSKPLMSLRFKIDETFRDNKMSDAAFWGSFSIPTYENSLFNAAFGNGNLMCAQLYLARGKHPTDSRCEYNCSSPLGLALFAHHSTVACLLLNAGADPNHKDGESGAYPICTAAQNNDPACVRLLLEKGANKNLELALQWGARNNSLEIVKLLLAAGANPNKVSSGHKAIVEAATHQNVEMVQLLLSHGAKINPNRYHLRYALQRAKETKNNALAAILENGNVILP